jgi:membrane protein YqaA with SNARE-associated domain
MEIEHKQTASKFKNRFASQLYAILEVGSLAFYLPVVFKGDSAAQSLLIAVAVCLFAGSVGSLFLPNWQEPPKVGHQEVDENVNQEETSEANLLLVVAMHFPLLGKVSLTASSACQPTIGLQLSLSFPTSLQVPLLTFIDTM